MKNSNIQDRAMLVGFHIGLPTNLRENRSRTEEIKRDKQLGHKAGKWSDYVLPPDRLSPVAQMAGSLRNWHYSQTLVWPEKGWHILTMKNYWNYTKHVGKGFTDYDVLVERNITSQWEGIVQWAKEQQNGGFRPELYHKTAVLESFVHSLDFRPISASNHFAAQIREVLGDNATAIDAWVEKAVTAAQDDLWGRVKKILTEVVDLGAKKNKPQERLVKRLFADIADLKQSIPSLNLSEDQSLDQFAATITDAFNGFDPMAVRDDKAQTKQAVDTATKLQQELESKQTKASSEVDEILRKLNGYSM